MGNFGEVILYRSKSCNHVDLKEVLRTRWVISERLFCIGAKAATTLILKKSLELDQHISDRFLYQSVCGNVKR